MKSSHFLCVISITLLLMGSFICICVARDTITVNNLLKDGETLVSAGRRFELGFFTPEGSIDRGKYVGIWYYSTVNLPRTVVWVANRDNPVPRSANPVILAIVDGNLKLLDGKGTAYFFTGVASSTGVNRTVILLDSGNLALIDGQSGAYLWQSFAYPTDTFLPGMLMDDNLKLISWLSHDNPKTGNYTFQKDQEDNKQFKVTKRSVLTWKSDQSGRFAQIEMASNALVLLSNFSKIEFGNRIQDSFKLLTNTRLLMNYSGEIQYWDHTNGSSLLWSEPNSPCSAYNPCGNFGICSDKNGKLTCECLPGFKPDSVDNWNSGEFSNGCARKSPICNRKTKPDVFLNLKQMKVGSKFSAFPVDSEKECREECVSNCHCQAYSYIYMGQMGRIGSKNNKENCFIWETDLNNLQKEYHYSDGTNFSVSFRVAASDIESTSRDCESCGQNILPYPLSRGPDCGDPSYNSFKCDDSKGQLQFLTPNGSFEVISINKDEHRMVIQANEAINASDCGGKDLGRRALMLSQSLPFDVTNWCYNNVSISNDSIRMVELSWRAPREPLCNSSDNCIMDWPYSGCNVTSDGMKRCLCNPNYHWDGLTLNCTLAVAAVEEQSKHATAVTKLIVSITVVGTVVLLGSISCFFFTRRKLVKRKEREEYNQRILDDSEKQDQNLVLEDDNVVDVPFFSLESILAATDNFSDANKLGRGGFGPVYKGIFPGGKEIAVKRLSSHSGQGIQEFQNEVRLIAKLQHRNLVRLLGYCIKGSEKLLLYEYMINKSLDTFIFDEGRCMLLDWEKRFEIIIGITRGLLYLHQDSRLRVIHRDLKTSNILLDEELNPKISDFGLARIVAGKETEVNTERVVGTYGYMSPEYALEGSFSIKSDVFSFGVILLEIISGKRNAGFYDEVFSLLGYAWKLWQERKTMEFIDKTLLESCLNSANEVLKCINIGLLCVQEDPVDRPTMANVLMMLGTETVTLPNPNQPAFISRKRPDSSISGSSSGKLNSRSINKMTVSAFEGR